MSVSKWAYIPARCDGDVCPGDCDVCSKTQMDGMTTERAITLLDDLRQCYGWGDVIIHSDDAEALTMAIEALERDRWISVKDALPDNDQDVLVMVHWNDYPEDMMVYGRRYKTRWYLWNGELGEIIKGFDITHWRPLPEPPKEET